MAPASGECHAGHRIHPRRRGPDRRHPARYPRPSGARLPGAPHVGSGRQPAHGLGHPDPPRHGHHRHRRHHQGRHQQAHDRPARRHGCAADHRIQHLRPQEHHAGQDARVRPRRPHRHAAGRRQAPGQAPQLRRHRPPHLPAGRRRRRRCPRDGRGRPVRAVPHGRRLRRPQLARHGGRPVRAQDRPGLRVEQRIQDRDPWQGLARRHAAQRHRPGAGGLPDGQRLPDHHQPQQAADRCRRDLGDHDPHRRGDQRGPRQLRDPGHGAHLHDRGARSHREAHAGGGRAHGGGLRRHL